MPLPTNLQEVVALFLLSIIPDPFIWAILFLIVFTIILAVIGSPGTVTAQYLFLSVWVISGAIGGPLNAVQMLGLVTTGFVLVLAALKLGNR